MRNPEVIESTISAAGVGTEIGDNGTSIVPSSTKKIMTKNKECILVASIFLQVPLASVLMP